MFAAGQGCSVEGALMKKGLAGLQFGLVARGKDPDKIHGDDMKMSLPSNMF
jgi:hypothetical protein